MHQIDAGMMRTDYQPRNQGGQELLAHELTHVVQQNGGAVQQFGSADLNRRID